MTRLTSPRRRRLLATTMVTALLAGSLLITTVPASAADDPIDGPRTAGDPLFPHVGNGGYDALDYDIDITWSPTGTTGPGNGAVVTGRFDAASMTMTARAAAPLLSFSLDFEGLTVDSVLVDGAPAAWSRDIDAAAVKHKLIVTPATPVSGDFSVTVKYSGVPVHHIDADGSQEGWSGTNDGAILLGQPVGMMTGFPHNNTPADKATYAISVNVPSTLTDVAGVPGPAAVASNGELAASFPSLDGERTTWVWYQSKPMASELVVIAIGRFNVIAGNVTLTDGRSIPSLSFVDFGFSEANTTSVRNRLAQLQSITQNLETIYGPYPGNSTGAIVKTVPRSINYALETQDRSFFPSAASVNGTTFIHELVHQWYGNAVSPTTWTDIWMSEGMATWGPSYYNSSEGFGSGVLSEQTYFNAWNASSAGSANWNIAPGAQTDSAELYSFQTYSRGAQFWAALRVAMGDTAFFTLIKDWPSANAGQSRTGADLKAAAEALAGIDLTSFWNDWIMESGKPAWPDKLSVALTGGSATGLLPGDSVDYAVTATNTGRVPLASSSVTIDLSALLANATLDAVPSGATLSGTTLTWAVPAGTAVGASATLNLRATIAEASSGGTFATSARITTVGGTCADCVVETAVATVLQPSAAPTIAGQAVVGQTLTATSTGWPEGTALSYVWSIDGEPVDPAQGALVAARAVDAGPQFVVPAAAVGARITVTVTGSLAGFRDGSVTSDPTAVVTAAAAGGGSGNAGTTTPGDRLGETGTEPLAAAALLALALLVGGGILAAARRRRRLDA